MEDVLNPTYWRERIEDARKTQFHHSIFKCDIKRWRAIEEKHKEILKKLISPTDNILDVGCGYGRLLELLPSDYQGFYHGVDLSPEFIKEANKKRVTTLKRSTLFTCCSILDYLKPKTEIRPTEGYGWGILISFKPMIIRNCGEPYWEEINTLLKKQCRKLLFLEYDVKDEGTIYE